MKGRYIIVFCLCFGFLPLLKAQSAGYLGKRLFVGYGVNTSPALFGATAQNETILGTSGSASSGSMVFNLIHEGYLEVAPSSKLTLGLSVRYYKTCYDNAREFSSLSYYSTGYSYFNDQPSGYYNVRGLSYTLYMRYFGTRYIAPWGRYFVFGPVINTVKTEYDPTVMNVKAYDNYYSGSSTGPNEVTITDFGAREQEYMGVNLMFGAGRSRIVGKRVSIDYGFNTHLFSLVSTLFDITESGFFRVNQVSHSNYIQETVKTRVRGINRFNVYLKVGFLLL